MINFDALNEPRVLLLLAAIIGVVFALVLAVLDSIKAPTKKVAFEEALQVAWSSELDIDTALNKSETTKRSWAEYWADLTSSSGRVVADPAAPGRFAAGVAIFAAMIGFLVFPGGVVGALVAPPVGLVLLRAALGYDASKRVRAMEKQLPNLLSGLRANLQAGSTPQQAMLAVADDMPSPLGDEMRDLKRDLNVNVAMEIAIRDLAARVPSREMKFLVASIEIAVRSGADLDPQLAIIEDIVAQRTRIRAKLRAAIAQSKPTQMLALGAVPGMFLFSLRAPENRAYWFSDGLLFLVIAGVLYAGGYLAIRFMIKGVENAQ